MKSTMFASQAGATLWIVASAGVLGGAFMGWAAFTDRHRMFSRWYEENKDSKIGFWAISPDEKTFRMWFVLSGAVLMAIGIAALVVAI